MNHDHLIGGRPLCLLSPSAPCLPVECLITIMFWTSGLCAICALMLCMCVLQRCSGEAGRGFSVAGAAAFNSPTACSIICAS